MMTVAYTGGTTTVSSNYDPHCTCGHGRIIFYTDEPNPDPFGFTAEAVRKKTPPHHAHLIKPDHRPRPDKGNSNRGKPAFRGRR